MTYEEVIKTFESMNCFSLSKAGDKYASDTKIFYIKGTRISVIVMKKTNYSWGHLRGNSEEDSYVTMKWKMKHKYKKKYADLSFEDVLESTFINEKYKAELLFYLDVFRSIRRV